MPDRARATHLIGSRASLPASLKTRHASNAPHAAYCTVREHLRYIAHPLGDRLLGQHRDIIWVAEGGAFTWRHGKSSDGPPAILGGMIWIFEYQGIQDVSGVTFLLAEEMRIRVATVPPLSKYFRQFSVGTRQHGIRTQVFACSVIFLEKRDSYQEWLDGVTAEIARKI